MMHFMCSGSKVLHMIEKLNLFFSPVCNFVVNVINKLVAL